MKPRHYITFSVVSMIFASQAQAEAMQPIGWIENVQLNTHDLVMTAKIDTGADNSSVHADKIEIFERDGRKVVRFEIANTSGESRILEKPLIRIAQIKRKGAEPLQRPVVNLDLCIGNTVKTAQINLANRGNFKYRMLIGRSYLKDSYLVDSNRRLTTRPACTSAQKVAMGKK